MKTDKKHSVGRKKIDSFPKLLNIPIELKKPLEDLAKKENRDLSNLLVTIIKNYVEESSTKV